MIIDTLFEEYFWVWQNFVDEEIRSLRYLSNRY